MSMSTGQPGYASEPYRATSETPPAPRAVRDPRGAPGRVARLGTRALACIVDLVLVGIVGGILAAALLLTVGPSVLLASGVQAYGLLAAAPGVVVLLAYVVMQAFGGSLAQRWFGVRLVTVDTGERIGFWRALGRHVVWSLGGIIVVGFFSPLFDRSGLRQGWHDKATRTLVADVARSRAAVGEGSFAPEAAAPDGVAAAAPAAPPFAAPMSAPEPHVTATAAPPVMQESHSADPAALERLPAVPAMPPSVPAPPPVPPSIPDVPAVPASAPAPPVPPEDPAPIDPFAPPAPGDPAPAPAPGDATPAPAPGDASPEPADPSETIAYASPRASQVNLPAAPPSPSAAPTPEPVDPFAPPPAAVGEETIARAEPATIPVPADDAVPDETIARADPATIPVPADDDVSDDTIVLSHRSARRPADDAIRLAGDGFEIAVDESGLSIVRRTSASDVGVTRGEAEVPLATGVPQQLAAGDVVTIGDRSITVGHSPR